MATRKRRTRKLTGSAKARFLARMAAGRRKAGKKAGRRKGKRTLARRTVSAKHRARVSGGPAWGKARRVRRSRRIASAPAVILQITKKPRRWTKKRLSRKLNRPIVKLASSEAIVERRMRRTLRRGTRKQAVRTEQANERIMRKAFTRAKASERRTAASLIEDATHPLLARVGPPVRKHHKAHKSSKRRSKKGRFVRG